MKNKYLFMGSISALAGILLIILIAINVILVQDEFLKYTNHKYYVEQNLAMTSDDLDKVTEQMISYVKGFSDSPQIVVPIKGAATEFFNKKEIGHLTDVRELIIKIYVFMVVALVVCVLGVRKLIKEKAFDALIHGVKRAWGGLLLVSVVIGILALIDIDLVITGFHVLFLSDSAWVLNPALDRSVWMFKTYMYVDVIIVIGCIVAAVAIASAVGVVVGSRILKRG